MRCANLGLGSTLLWTLQGLSSLSSGPEIFILINTHPHALIWTERERAHTHSVWEEVIGFRYVCTCICTGISESLEIQRQQTETRHTDLLKITRLRQGIIIKITQSRQHHSLYYVYTCRFEAHRKIDWGTCTKISTEIDTQHNILTDLAFDWLDTQTDTQTDR